MNLPGASRVGTVGRSDSVQASPPAKWNLLVSRPRGSPDDSYPDFKGDSSGRKDKGSANAQQRDIPLIPIL